MLHARTSSYHSLGEKHEDEEERGVGGGGARQAYLNLKRGKRRSDVTALFLGLALLLQTIWSWTSSSSSPPVITSSSSDQTDFSGIRSTIGEEKRLFDSWTWNDEYKFIKRPVDLSKPQYFGNPKIRTDIEGNWEKLLEVQFFALSDEEGRAYPDLLPPPGQKYKYMELDVTHKLHCLNKVRKMLYASYYNQSVHLLQSRYMPPGFYLEHMDHCLENLMEGVICHSDLTPAPVLSVKPYTPGMNNATYTVSETHTCRSFEQVRQWLYERAKKRPSMSWSGKIFKPGQ